MAAVMPAAANRAAKDGPAWPVPMMMASNCRGTRHLLYGRSQATFGGCAGAVLAGRAAADDDHVVVAYVGSSVPACSATMYAAYQSDQFSSRCPPIRFSYCPWAVSARRNALARSFADAKVVAVESMRPASRVVISWNSQPLPSGSWNEANER